MNEILSAIAAHGDTFGIGVMFVALLGVIGRGFATGNILFLRELNSRLKDKDAELARNEAANNAELQRMNDYYDKLIKLKDDQIAAYHNAWQNEAIARQDQGRRLDDVNEAVRTTEQILRAFPKAST